MLRGLPPGTGFSAPWHHRLTPKPLRTSVQDFSLGSQPGTTRAGNHFRATPRRNLFGATRLGNQFGATRVVNQFTTTRTGNQCGTKCSRATSSAAGHLTSKKSRLRRLRHRLPATAAPVLRPHHLRPPNRDAHFQANSAHIDLPPNLPPNRDAQLLALGPHRSGGGSSQPRRT